MRSINYLPIVAILASSACFFAINGDGTLTLINNSTYVIDELRLAERGDAHFGPDLTGQESLFPGEVFTVELPCDDYDLQLMDEFGTQCVLHGIHACSDGALFRVTDALISDCGFTLGS